MQAFENTIISSIEIRKNRNFPWHHVHLFVSKTQYVLRFVLSNQGIFAISESLHLIYACCWQNKIPWVHFSHTSCLFSLKIGQTFYHQRLSAWKLMLGFTRRPNYLFHIKAFEKIYWKINDITNSWKTRAASGYSILKKIRNMKIDAVERGNEVKDSVVIYSDMRLMSLF